VDGLPLNKNTSSHFWPILACIVGTSKIVFPVGVYHGFSKPKDSDVFLSDFIVEAKDLLTNGISINSIHLKVTIKGLVCDTPAKSFVLNTKRRSDFSTCSRCTIEGNFQNRMYFSYSKNKCPKRTHESYAQMVYENYHVILVELPGFNLVKSFSLDYMHLVLIGVTHQLVVLWLHKRSLHTRLPNRSLYNLFITSFKKIYSFRFFKESQNIGRWKATELRLFFTVY